MKRYLENSLTYAQYTKLIDDLLIEGKTTGPNQSETMFHYGKMNRLRMHRLEKTVVLGDDVKSAARELRRKMIWLVITEGWCGDAAQNIPIIEKIAAESGNIETRYILRDENLGLIDQFLTEGARSIPKLIAFDSETLEVLGTWGARPAAAQELYLEMKSQDLAKPLMMENLQRWYNNDKSRSIQSEFAELIRQWGGEEAVQPASSGLRRAAFSFLTFL